MHTAGARERRASAASSGVPTETETDRSVSPIFIFDRFIFVDCMLYIFHPKEGLTPFLWVNIHV
jgi:hypothetical protein